MDLSAGCFSSIDPQSGGVLLCSRRQPVDGEATCVMKSAAIEMNFGSGVRGERGMGYGGRGVGERTEVVQIVSQWQ